MLELVEEGTMGIVHLIETTIGRLALFSHDFSFTINFAA